jgi:hypothetical protein
VGDALFEIDPDIRVARTLPARVYSDPEIFRLQRDRLFARTWHYAGHDDLEKIDSAVAFYEEKVRPELLSSRLVPILAIGERLPYIGRPATLPPH